MFSFNVYAECDEEGYFDCGNTGEVRWYVSEDKTTLTISGTGNMGNYSANIDNNVYTTTAPWQGYQNSLKNVDVQSGVTGLGTYAFLGMDKIENVNLPDTLLDIGRSSFNRCYGLQNIAIPESVQTLGEYSLQMTGIESIVVPDSVTTISPLAFGYNSQLKSIVIGENVSTIYSQAFEGSNEAHIYCQETSAHSCQDLINANNPEMLDKLVIYSVDNKGRVKIGSKSYDSLADFASVHYVPRRVYTLKEANQAAGKKNKVMIRYK